MTIINQIRLPRTPFAPSDLLARATRPVSDAERARLIADASRTRDWMLELEQRVETVGLTAAGHFKRCHDRRLPAAAESSTPDAEIADSLVRYSPTATSSRGFTRRQTSWMPLIAS